MRKDSPHSEPAGYPTDLNKPGTALVDVSGVSDDELVIRSRRPVKVVVVDPTRAKCKHSSINRPIRHNLWTPELAKERRQKFLSRR